MKEIEILVRLHSSIEEAERAILRSAKHIKTEHVQDTYFVDPLRDELSPDENGILSASCRLREEKSSQFLTYKVDHFDDSGNWTYSDEYETTIGSTDTVMKILQFLGLETLVTVKMKKHLYMTSDLHIVIEEVEGLGNFLEVEARNVDAAQDPLKIKKEIEDFIGTLGLETSREFDGGKPELLLQKRNNS